MYTSNKTLVNGIVVLLSLLLFMCNKNNPTGSTTDDNGDPGPLADIDGNVYQTVQIGDQWWITENLKVTHFRNGDPIPNVTDNTAWIALSTSAYCAYENDESNADTYGYLYNWYAVNDNRNIAPAGWHVPTESDWNELEQFLGMDPAAENMTGWRGVDEGNKMKSTTGWGPDDDGNNESGLSLLPGGLRGGDGSFSSMGDGGSFWSSSRSSSQAWYRWLGTQGPAVFRSSYSKVFGCIVRLVRD